MHWQRIDSHGRPAGVCVCVCVCVCVYARSKGSIDCWRVLYGVLVALGSSRPPPEEKMRFIHTLLNRAPLKRNLVRNKNDKRRERAGQRGGQRGGQRAPGPTGEGQRPCNSVAAALLGLTRDSFMIPPDSLTGSFSSTEFPLPT